MILFTREHIPLTKTYFKFYIIFKDRYPPTPNERLSMWGLVHHSEESGPQYKGKKDKEQAAKDNPADVSHEDVCSIAPDETDHEMPELVSMIASHLVYASSIAGKT